MALFEDMFKGNVMTGAAIGAAAFLLGPTLLPTIGRVLHPVAKAVIRETIVFYRETVNAIGEVTAELVSEAKNELEQASRAQDQQSERPLSDQHESTRPGH